MLKTERVERTVDNQDYDQAKEPGHDLLGSFFGLPWESH
jgi:hypothetical protein